MKLRCAPAASEARLGELMVQSNRAQLAAQAVRAITKEVRRWQPTAWPIRNEAHLRAAKDRARRRTTQGLTALLLEAIAATGADFGNIQIMDLDGLHIATQFGFQRPFLDFFSCVRGPGSACGAAMDGSRIVVEDVSNHPIFRGTAAADVLHDAKVRSVQSTPLLDASARLIGVLSTHFKAEHRYADGELAILDGIAQRAARWTGLSEGLL